MTGMICQASPRLNDLGEIELTESSGYEVLDQSALATVKKWRFTPAKEEVFFRVYKAVRCAENRLWF